jgi:hypothetical protein
LAFLPNFLPLSENNVRGCAASFWPAEGTTTKVFKAEQKCLVLMDKNKKMESTLKLALNLERRL